MTIVNLLDLFKDLLEKSDDHHLLKSIANNTHYGFASALDAIKLFPHVYEHNKYEVMMTIDFDITLEQYNKLLQEFSDRKINLMLGFDVGSPNTPGRYCIENNICIANQKSECCKKVIDFIDKNVAKAIEKSKYSKVSGGNTLYSIIVLFSLREYGILEEKQEKALLKEQDHEKSLSLQHISECIGEIFTEEVKTKIKQFTSDGDVTYTITQTWMSPAKKKESPSTTIKTDKNVDEQNILCIMG